jgi:hypothetical protein
MGFFSEQLYDVLAGHAEPPSAVLFSALPPPPSSSRNNQRKGKKGTNTTSEAAEVLPMLSHSHADSLHSSYALPQLEVPLRGHLTSYRCKLTAPFVFSHDFHSLASRCSHVV